MGPGPPTCNSTIKPRRDASDLIRRDASAPTKTDQTWYSPTSNPTLKPRREASDLIRNAIAPVKTDQTWYPPTSNLTPKTRRDVSDLIRRDASAPTKTDQSWHPPTSSPTLKSRRDAIELIRTSLDPSSCPQTSSGETATLPTSAMEPTFRARPTARDKEYYLHLQHISPHNFCSLIFMSTIHITTSCFFIYL
jgi:hypothetical protein